MWRHFRRLKVTYHGIYEIYGRNRDLGLVPGRPLPVAVCPVPPSPPAIEVGGERECYRYASASIPISPTADATVSAGVYYMYPLCNVTHPARGRAERRGAPLLVQELLACSPPNCFRGTAAQLGYERGGRK